MIYAEEQEQRAVFDWAAYHFTRWPELMLMHHIPNGGYRTAREAAILRGQGVRAGVPDICLPVARHGYHGLYIEMKAKKGTVSRIQEDWLKKLNAQGYKAVVCYGREEAVSTLEEYLTEEQKDE